MPKRDLLVASGLVAGVAALFAFGVWGVGRGGGYFDASNVDLRYIHSAGADWLHGESPYDGAAFVGRARERYGVEILTFAYPPQIAPLCLFLGGLSLPAAMVAMTVLNAGGMLAVLLAVRSLLTRAAEASLPAWAAAFLAAVTVGNPFASHVLWMGQTSVLSAAGVLAAFALHARARPVLAGIALGAATIKPQIAVLPVVWFLLSREWRLLVVAAGTAVLASAVPMAVSGPVGAFREWFDALREYREGHVTVLGFRHVFGIGSALREAGIPWGPPLWAAALVPVALRVAPSRHRPVDIAAVLLCGAWLFGYSHDYDLAAAGVVVASALTRTRVPWVRALLVAAVLVLFFPQRVFQEAGMGLAARSRELALLAVAAFVAFGRPPAPDLREGGRVVPPEGGTTNS